MDALIEAAEKSAEKSEHDEKKTSNSSTRNVNLKDPIDLSSSEKSSPDSDKKKPSNSSTRNVGLKDPIDLSSSEKSSSDSDKKEPLKFPCDFKGCRKILTTKSSFIMHRRSHNRTTRKCSQCERTFRTKKGYREHLELHLFNREMKEMEEMDEMSDVSREDHRKNHRKDHRENHRKDHESVITNSNFVYLCHYKDCTEIFDLKDELLNHFTSHLRYFCIHDNC